MRSAGLPVFLIGSPVNFTDSLIGPPITWHHTAESHLRFPYRQSSGGQLGLGNDFDYWTPTPVPAIRRGEGGAQSVLQRAEGADPYALPEWRVCQVSAGFNHTAAVIEAYAD